MNKNTYINDKRGIWFLTSWALAGVFGILAIIFFSMLLFNENINSAVSTFINFLNGAKIYILVGIGLIVGYKTGIIKWIFTFTRSIFKI